MTEKQMLKALSERVNTLGATKVAASLNYKDARTVTRWIDLGRIPHWKVNPVKEYLIKNGFRTITRKRK